MSTVTSAVTTCPDLQVGLENIFETCTDIGHQLRNKTLIQFLYSPENRSGIDFLVSPTFGKTRELLAVYDQLIPDSEVTTISDCDGNCTATTERGDLSTTYTMDCDGFMVEELFDPASWRLSCTNNYEKIQRTILKLIAALDSKVSTSVVSEVGGLRGDWDSAVTTTGDALVVNTQLASSVTPNPNAWADIDLALMQTGFCREVFIASGADLYSYNRIMSAGCCADSGLNLAEMFATYGKAVSWDRDVQDALGKEQAYAIMAGAVQLLTLNMNGGTETEIAQINVGTGAGSSFAAVVNSPFTGLPYDVTVEYVCRKIHLIVEGRVKAVGMPIDMFPSGYHAEGVTYVNQISVVNT